MINRCLQVGRAQNMYIYHTNAARNLSALADKILTAIRHDCSECASDFQISHRDTAFKCARSIPQTPSTLLFTMTTATITKTTFATSRIPVIVKTSPTLGVMVICAVYYVLEIRVRGFGNGSHIMPSSQTYQLRMPIKTSEESVEEEN